MGENQALSVGELRDRILELAVNEPEVTRACVRRALNSVGGKRSVAAFCQALGQEYSRRIFEGLSSEEWAELSFEMRQMDGARQAELLRDLHRAVVWEKLGWDEKSLAADPFEFLEAFEGEHLERVLQGVLPRTIALISAFWSPARMTRLLDALPERARKQAVLEIALLEKLPPDALRSAALAFAVELKAKANGPVPPVFQEPEKPIAEISEHIEARQKVADVLARLRASEALQRKALDFIRAEAKSVQKESFPGASYERTQAQLEAALEEAGTGETVPFVPQSAGSA